VVSGTNPGVEDEARLPRYTVRAVAQRLGVPTATLRSWNQRYGVGPPDHSPGRHRLYSESDIAVLQHMHSLIGEGANARTAARAAMEAVRPQRADVASLLGAAFDLDAAEAGRLLDGHLRHYGVLGTWDELVRPAFSEIEAQQVGGRCIDVEHVLSWVVTRSLQRLPTAPPDGTARVMLACTGKEAHTLPLEALRAALGERGRSAVMLGAAVPLDALVEALERRAHCNAVVLWSHTEHTADVDMVRAMLAMHAEVMLGGPGWESTSAPKGAVWVDSLQTAVQRLTPAD
jgi:MerR family transcriptional regulator, light-induced transcriptional regulator